MPRQRLRAAARHEGGSQLIEWVGVGAALALLIAGLYTALIGNAGLRQQIGATVRGYAVSFGQDVVARGPGLPQGSLLPAGGELRSSIDPASGVITLIDPASGARRLLRPGPGIAVSVDAASGQVSLSDPRRGLTALITPALNRAALINHDTGVRRPSSLDALAAAGVVMVEEVD